MSCKHQLTEMVFESVVRLASCFSDVYDDLFGNLGNKIINKNCWTV